MVDSLNVSQDSHINHIVELSKKTNNSGKIHNNAKISADIYFSVDTDANVSGEFTSGDGKVVSIRYYNSSESIHGNKIIPRWIAVHFRLGEISLKNKTAIGVVIKSEAPTAVTMRACLRSGSGGTFLDEFFSKHIVSYQNSSTHLDILKIEDFPEQFPLEKADRDLILFLPPQDSSLTISDLRVFIV